MALIAKQWSWILGDDGTAWGTENRNSRDKGDRI